MATTFDVVSTEWSVRIMATVAVNIHNKLSQQVAISLKDGDGVKEVPIPPKGKLPNANHPTAVTSSDITAYTKGLASKGYIRIRPVA